MRILIFTILLLSSQLAFGQQDSVSVKEKINQFKNKITRQVSRADSIKLRKANDSLAFNLNDSLKRKNHFANINKTDSLDKIGFEKPSLGIDTINLSRIPRADNLPSDSIKTKIDSKSNQLNQKLAAIQQRAQAKSDSLDNSGALKGLQNKATSEAVKMPTGNLPVPGTNKNSFTIPAQPVNSIQLPQGQTNNNVSGLQLPGQPPGTASPELKLPNQTDIPKAPGINLPEQTDKLPNAEILNPTGLKEKLDLPSTDIPSLEKPDSTQINQLKERAQEDERLKKYAQPVIGVSDQVDPYRKRLDSLDAKDVVEIASTETEDILGNTRAVKMLDEQVNLGQSAMAMPQQAAMIQRYQDKKILKDEMLRKSKNVMNDKITSMTPQIQEQQEKFAKARKLNTSVSGIKKGKQKHTDPLRDKPFYERIIPGISLQSYAGNVFAIDIAPQVAGRITSYWDIGAGLFYRAGFDKKYDSFVSGQGVHGFRGFMDYRLVKGIFLHSEYERTLTTPQYQYSDKQIVSTYNNVYVGLGKRYPISRKFNGSLLALYKIELEEHLIGTSKFNLRLVFEYKTKKIRKPTSIN